MRAYGTTPGSTRPPAEPLRQTHGIVGAGARVEACACGGEVYCDSMHSLAIEAAVRAHQGTAGHRLWWARAQRAGWGA